MSDDDVLAHFASKPADTDEDVQSLLAALLSKYSDLEDSKWPTILREFNSRAASPKNKQWIKRAAEKCAKKNISLGVAGTSTTDAGMGKNAGPIERRDCDRLLNIDPIYCSKSSIHGWGVFASRRILKGETVHLTPFRHLDLTTACTPAAIIKPDVEGIAMFQKVLPKEVHTDLFAGRTETERILVLGLGSFFNHNADPSTGYKFDHDAGTCRFFALRDILEGEELLISYGKTYFEERGMEQTK